ncbi:MAG: DUF2892 domain-containing protein [Methylococcales bacterium]|nr:DUF2892 domain-containing protein [Methylococcales bacterium]
MTIDRWVMAFAGGFILISVGLAFIHSMNWLWFTGFVGLNLFQAAFTRFCPLAVILKRFGVKSGNVF